MGNLTGPTLTISDNWGEYEYKERSRVKSNLRLKLLFWQAGLSLGCMGHNKWATCPPCRAGKAFHVCQCSASLCHLQLCHAWCSTNLQRVDRPAVTAWRTSSLLPVSLWKGSPSTSQRQFWQDSACSPRSTTPRSARSSVKFFWRTVDFLMPPSLKQLETFYNKGCLFQQ